MSLKYALHHIPKCAGSTIQMRMIQAEYNKELPAGSTLIRYEAVGREWEYRLADDPDYNPDESLHQHTLPRHRGKQQTGNHDVIVAMGHLIDHTWPGEHLTWIRNPLERDISHFNYDLNLGRHTKSWRDWNGVTPPNWICMWLYTQYLKQPYTDDEHMFEAVTNCKLNIRTLENLEKDYASMCVNLNINVSKANDNSSMKKGKMISIGDMSYDDIENHKVENYYDWKLYELYK